MQEHMRQHTARVSMQWSALLDALGELVSASHDDNDDDDDDDESGGPNDEQPHGEAADVERAPSRKWLGRCGQACLSSAIARNVRTSALYDCPTVSSLA